MKDAIPALEGTRAAEHAGGYEKHDAARLAKGKLTALSFVLAVAVGSTSVAFAQSSSQSFDGGAFTLTYPSHWIPAEGFDDVSRGQALLVVRPATGASVERFAQCSLAREQHPNNLTQGALNAVVAGWTADNFHDPAHTLLSFSNEQVGGIRVASVVDEFVEPASGKTIRNFERHFAIVQGAEFASYFLWCGLAVPADAQDLAEVEAFAASLSFAR